VLPPSRSSLSSSVGRSHRAWHGMTHIRPCGHDRSKSTRATHESWRGVPLGDARSVLVCGYVGGPRLAPYLVVSLHRCGLVRFCVFGLCSSQAPLARMAASASRRARRLVYRHGNRARGRQLGTLTGTRGVASPWAWALPTVVGSPIIAWGTREVALGRRPKL
jgi:hypothetical protein